MARWRIPSMGAEGESKEICETLRQKDSDDIKSRQGIF